MLNNNVELRKVRKNDRKKIKEICDKSFPEGEDAYFIVESFINVEHFYVAEFAKKKEICGFVIFGIFSIKTAHLMILAVHPKYQRHGIGTKLLERVIEVVAFTPINTIRLEVRTTNKIAIEFYEKYDFTIATTIEKYYDNVDGDAFLMVRKIE